MRAHRSIATAASGKLSKAPEQFTTLQTMEEEEEPRESSNVKIIQVASKICTTKLVIKESQENKTNHMSLGHGSLSRASMARASIIRARTSVARASLARLSKARESNAGSLHGEDQQKRSVALIGGHTRARTLLGNNQRQVDVRPTGSCTSKASTSFGEDRPDGDVRSKSIVNRKSKTRPLHGDEQELKSVYAYPSNVQIFKEKNLKQDKLPLDSRGSGAEMAWHGEGYRERQIMDNRKSKADTLHEQDHEKEDKKSLITRASKAPILHGKYLREQGIGLTASHTSKVQIHGEDDQGQEIRSKYSHTPKAHGEDSQQQDGNPMDNHPSKDQTHRDDDQEQYKKSFSNTKNTSDEKISLAISLPSSKILLLSPQPSEKKPSVTNIKSTRVSTISGRSIISKDPFMLPSSKTSLTTKSDPTLTGSFRDNSAIGTLSTRSESSFLKHVSGDSDVKNTKSSRSGRQTEECNCFQSLANVPEYGHMFLTPTAFEVVMSFLRLIYTALGLRSLFDR